MKLELKFWIVFQLFFQSAFAQNGRIRGDGGGDFSRGGNYDVRGGGGGGGGGGGEGDGENRSLFPNVINLATMAHITANATCGHRGQEEYCKLTDHSHNRAPQCDICDERSSDPARRHPITNAIDGTNSWWQSPSLAQGTQYQWVTITLDLKQIYQVAYVIVKSAISPRPANWILERSLDGRNFEPWQYHALDDAECLNAYRVPASRGRAPTFTSDTQVICTSYFSDLHPLEGGEAHVSLVNRRPGSGGPSEDLLKFTEARYVRLRLQKLRTLHGELQERASQSDSSVTKRYFYSIKDISIGGRCVCNGHANNCDTDGQETAKCACVHNTCGDQCDRCCLMFNQKPWRHGNSSDSGICEKCQCYGHADSCIYDQEVDAKKLSVNTRGEYEGGGVCLNCRHNTDGNNCEKCKSGFYRPQGVSREDVRACQPCTCSGPGTTGDCVPDDTQANLGLFPGACICREGFHGPRCDRCDRGYRRFPQCEPCPCNRAGSVNDECEGECICKDNVVGPRCDTCAPGHFHLDARNPVGCTRCYCNGATSSCEAAKLAVYTVLEHSNWYVTDLLKRRKVAASQEGTDARIAHDSMADFESYYWLAPDEYLGSRTTSYGQTLTVRVSWVKLRGDTSGEPTRCPDVIIEGAGYRIAYGDNVYRRGVDTTLEIPFYEHGWFHFPKDLSDIHLKTKRREYKGRAVTRREMMEILSSLQTLMIRARYHTVQIEGILHNVVLEYGEEGRATLVTGAVERCSCPPGYTGLSCESCAEGYRRVNNTVYGGVCLPCDCNGHAQSCDPYTGACGACQHNTVGDNCERCAAGFFGDATVGTPDACQPCECPLALGSNHFTPRCIPDLDLGTYRCRCPPGYDGRKCERCADGYFGNPFEAGQFCKPCECNGNIDPRQEGNCDRVTGQCLKCTGNTYGFNCEHCQDNYYRNPLSRQCLPCMCNSVGSVSSQCDPNTGQCQCRNLFAGRQCDRCVRGHGGVNEGCPRCQCDPEGSTSQICDPFTGACPCKPGVAGKSCTECLPDHFGSLANGCMRCVCNREGSTSSTCDIVTGQCPCKNHVVGRTCSACRAGYWGFRRGRGCRSCDCDSRGSISPQCDDSTGQCRCRPGVGGQRCDSCVPGYWGFSRQGCKPCDPCGGPGRYCDPDSGRCICPANTEGDRCERCSPGAWDYHASSGCKLCNCSGVGSFSQQCDPLTGRCVCRDGYEGSDCSVCSYGYYGSPQSRCIPCQCNIAGTNERNCDRNIGRCQCDNSGQCPCKSNVVGDRCGKCESGTFGLSIDNPLGCTSCFCFRRTTQCNQAQLTWFKLALPGDRILSFGSGETRLNMTNKLLVIPGTEGNVSIVSSLLFDAPLYWQLPHAFMRDKVRSYNGKLKFRIDSHGGSRKFPDQILQTYPLVSLQGNWRLVLEYFPQTISPDGSYEVRFHESEWRIKDNPGSVTRNMMMIALQNLQHILIRATDAADPTQASLHDVTMDIATEGSPVSSRVAVGVEQCVCPPSYMGTSCQNPNSGYYRWFKPNYIQSTVIIDLVGVSRPCQCNGRSETCDSETGECKNCRDNTSGPNCEVCATGYYGDPALDQCKPCACPSLQQNFAETCHADVYSDYICNCRTGYTGDKCDRCDFGYYGRPLEPGGKCIPCNCDTFGSLHEGCDENGQCSCKDGIRGRDCSQCANRHITSQTGCISCVDGCVDVLLDDVEDMIYDITSLDLDDGDIPAPWTSIKIIQNTTEVLRSQLNRYHSSIDESQDLVVNFDLDYTARDLLQRAQALEGKASETLPPTANLKSEAEILLELLNGIYFELDETIAYLKNYAIGETPSMSIALVLQEAEKILKEIKRRNFVSFEEEAETELRKAKELLERIKKMAQQDGVILVIEERIANIDNKLNELIEHINIARRKTDEAIKLNTRNKERLEYVKNYSDEIRSHNQEIEDQNFSSNQMLREANANLLNSRGNYGDIERMLIILRSNTTYLEDYERRLARLNNEYRDKYVNPAIEHAKKLMRESIRLESLFNNTRWRVVDYIKAAEAYQRIIDALNSAEEAAKNASEAAGRAFNKAYPGDPEESLVRRAGASKRKSEELQSKGEALRESVQDQFVELDKQQMALARTKATIDLTNTKINDITRIMDTQLNTDISLEIEEAISRANNTYNNVERTVEHIMSIQSNLTLIKEEALELGRQDTSLLNHIRDAIAEAEGNTVKGVRLSTNLRKSADRIENRSVDLRERIEALKRKIKQTRQHASSIRVSLTTDADGVCTRKYRPTLQPSTTTNIVLSYAIGSDQRNALLLYLGSHNSSDFMAVEMVNRHIEFTWDAGGGTQRITHPLTLRTNTPQVSDDTKWYHITINRVGNIGQLRVLPANIEGMRNDPITISDASPPGFSKMDLLPTDTLWVGGAPTHAYNSLKTRNFGGCLHTLTVDGEMIGLWNFTENIGCDACNEGEDLVLRQTDLSALSFNGKGYFRGTNRLRRPNAYYSVVLSFKSLDEDALLFLAVNEQKNQYFSIALERGHVVLTVQFDVNTKLVMTSSKKHNNNRDMIQIQAIVQNTARNGARMGRLMVGDQDQLGTVKGGPDLDLSRVPYYFGGVHPEFNRQRWGNELVLRSMLGCMSGLRVLDEGKNPLTDGQYYGIENSCSDKPLYDVGFLGQGYLELESHELKRDSNFGFTFQTMESDALLVVSTFIGQPLPPGEYEHPPDFYSVSLVEGHLDIRMDGGTGRHRVLSLNKYNDGKLHAAFVIKENRRVTLKVDDQEVNSTRLDRGGQVVSGPHTGGLYFGGVPADLNIGPMVGSSRPLKGCIMDVIVNNNVVSFSRPVRFQDVYIGRCADLPRNAMQGMEADMKEIHACLPPTQHTVEYGALKFGDRTNSHVRIPLNPSTFKKNFNVTFEFRTYYPNGLFFLASNTRKNRTQAISVQLRNGRVNVVIKKDGRKGMKDILAMSQPGLNTGHWKKVTIEKTRKRLRLFIDNELVKKVKVPRRINVGRELFLGGLPNNAEGLTHWQIQEVEPLRGCLRNLHINLEEYEIPSTRRIDHMVGVGQCFANVQPGSYFPGDAYAIYSNDFNVGPSLELRLEFRTWELNGIILSVADPTGTSLSLELVNGAVVLSVRVGNGHSFSARFGLRNRFSLCDNMWHTVKASYIKNSLTLRVDNHREVYGFNGAGDNDNTITGAPLYIGGLPEFANEGTLTTQENFKGCIRNIVLDSILRDWTDMYRLQNVLLSACPVQ